MKKKQRSACKEILEILAPIKRFYSMQHKEMIKLLFLSTILTGMVCFFVSLVFETKVSSGVEVFLKDILGDFISIMALFISFTMGYLSIIITSSSENINDLKETPSKYFKDENGKAYMLYQILVNDITYAVIVQIIFLIVCVVEKFLLVYCNSFIMKAFCAIDTSFFAHIILVLLIIIKNIYYSFWISK